jgi:peptidoglycan/xylan/chitin deacetylase (PgdA/CDA1 family)
VREQIKQLLKNSVYRALGETANGISPLLGDTSNGGGRSLRVLMYHKVNDLPNNRMSMPVSIFDEQMTQLRELGYRAIDLDAVLDHYVEGKPLAEGAVLITFDDGYRDNLENAAPVLHRHGYPAVQFVPLAYVGDRQPLPHEEHLAANGVINRTVDWEELGELERLGVRIESHGLSHRPLADLELDEAAREIAISKLRLEERLGRPVRAFSYVKGSEAHYKPVPASDRLQLRRYNVEPYSPRTFELVLAGACDLIAVKDTITGTRARRVFNAALGTSSK